MKEAQALLLSFDQVRGQAFERTIKVAADLSARLGTDLKTAVRQVGLALQDPVTGLTLLRRSGIAFTEQQKDLIKGLHEAGRAADAQNVILSELERRYAGAAAAARGTLGGAITGLKNAFGDLFEGTKEGTSGAADAINRLSDVLSNGAFKAGVDALISGLSTVVRLAAETAAGISVLLGLTGDEVEKLNSKIADMEGRIQRAKARGLPTAELERQREALARRQIEVIESRTPTPVAGSGVTGGAGTPTLSLPEFSDPFDRAQIARGEAQRGLIDLIDTGIGEGIEETIAETGRDLADLYKPVMEQTEELGEFIKGVWQETGASIQATISDAIYEWDISWDSLLDIARRALADIASAIITSGIKNLLVQQLSASGSSSSGSNAGLLLGALGAGLGGGGKGAAGGGRISGATIVGEEGPELLFGRGFVMNKRQMAFGGMGGASIVFAPVTNVNIIERENPQRLKQEVLAEAAAQNAQQQAEFVRLLGRSGVEVRG